MYNNLLKPPQPVVVLSRCRGWVSSSWTGWKRLFYFLQTKTMFEKKTNLRRPFSLLTVFLSKTGWKVSIKTLSEVRGRGFSFFTEPPHPLTTISKHNAPVLTVATASVCLPGNNDPLLPGRHAPATATGTLSQTEPTVWPHVIDDILHKLPSLEHDVERTWFTGKLAVNLCTTCHFRHN